MSEESEYVSVFSITKSELKKADDWIDAHEKTHISPGQPFRYTGAIGGAYTWSYTPTSIGTAYSVQCICGEKFDCTNYDLW